jgi:hypothetical protein
MHKAFKIYYRRNLTGVVPQNFSNQIILSMLLTLKKKREDAEKLKRERGRLDEYGIRVMNRLAANTYDDADKYNASVVPELDKLIVPYKDYLYKDSPYINPDFLTSVDIETLLRNKFQKNSKVKKTDADIKDILTTTQNLMNRTRNPQLILKTLANTSPNDQIFDDIVNTSIAQSQEEIEDAEEENDQIDSLINNYNSNSISGSGVKYLGIKRKKLVDRDDEEDDGGLLNSLVQRNYNNINNDASGFSSAAPPSYNQKSVTNVIPNLQNVIPV